MKRRDFLKFTTLSVLGLSATSNAEAAQPKRPNILWLTSEDNTADWLGCYNNPDATTPNLDQLAREGFRYTNCFANAPVCAPQRSTWITGVHAISMGTHPMRSRYQIPHEKIKYYPDHLKQAGYFVSNHTKTDYNIGGRPDKACWDSTADWRNRKPGQPFFSVINFAQSHESRAFGNVENTRHDPLNMDLPAYHPDIPTIRKNYAKYQDAVQIMDEKVGAAISKLKADGLYEDTIIVYCSDHGGVLPRSKRFLFDNGIHCPLIVRIPEKYKHLYPAPAPGTTVDDIVSFIDMPRTWLSLTAAPVPDHMQGRVFLGKTEPPRKYHFAWRGRMDERYDNQRAVRDKRYLYIKNYMPWFPWGQRLQYLWKMQATQTWQQHHQAGKTTAITARWFTPKPVEELYDTLKDPDCINNLADHTDQTQRLTQMRKALRDWQLKIHDSGLLPETERSARAEEHDVTIYEMVRNPKLYDLPAYLDAADLALQKDPANLPALTQDLDHPDSGIRWWAVVGLFYLGQNAAPAKAKLTAALTDPSHEVRAYTAWSLTTLGETERALQTFDQLIRDHSPATLTVLNILDQLGDSAKPLLQTVKQTELKDYNKRMKDYLLSKWSS
ncbi:Arylsulfatase [Anaerohalosphaera lusitana]|uniref:Arylsulfatase n=1 Tax=Anaerohalosphaera lusitana TaxID=1936003 RepID=A0A1U9NKD9_9BACT|nr:sulfatase-like hydrolase/transferase [Anaerohalosphaera lusitana]AQT67986.1 Arylsulfatase [Anaerohalosphaera lusitana]